jgi:hypothetical protein
MYHMQSSGVSFGQTERIKLRVGWRSDVTECCGNGGGSVGGGFLASRED